MKRCTRRSALRAGGIALLGSLAGCSATPKNASDSGDLTFERLDVTAVYVADGVDLSMPSEIETVTATNNADLLVLPGGTDTGAEQVVEWFADDRAVALVGADAEATWLSWARSDAFEDAFENQGVGDSEPDPSLVVGGTVGQYVRTYRRSWTDAPRDRDVLRAIDESLVDLADATPPN